MVKPGAKAPGIIVGADGSITVRVREPARDGEANNAVRRAIARAVGAPPSAVNLLRGASARRKLFSIDGLTAAEARSRLSRNALSTAR
ncbi:MAG TPA: DUF167 domain-containing protein [Candidatus Eremiobacteraceae bacterium]|nr:DUF167 domain-containing protein [Candidatus Eremiobacteraceae bacterium]